MCVPCEAAKDRLLAAHNLRDAVEGKYGLGPALKTVLPLPAPTAEWEALIARFDK